MVDEIEYGNGGQQGIAKKYPPMCQIIANESYLAMGATGPALLPEYIYNIFLELVHGCLLKSGRVVVRSGVYIVQGDFFSLGPP